MAASGGSSALPGGRGQALGAGGGLAGTAATLGQRCLAACGLFIRRGLFIYRALAARCQPRTGNSRRAIGPHCGGGGWPTKAADVHHPWEAVPISPPTPRETGATQVRATEGARSQRCWPSAETTACRTVSPCVCALGSQCAWWPVCHRSGSVVGRRGAGRCGDTRGCALHTAKGRLECKYWSTDAPHAGPVTGPLGFVC